MNDNRRILEGRGRAYILESLADCTPRLARAARQLAKDKTASAYNVGDFVDAYAELSAYIEVLALEYPLRYSDMQPYVREWRERMIESLKRKDEN